MHRAKISFIVIGSFACLQGALAQRLEWQSAPRMVLERQFAGPLTDTLIQRLRDPVDGSVCYIYLPISAAHTPKTDTGYVQYGPNAIGTISCTLSTQRPTARSTDPKK
jgi:hypothetical protein